MPSPVRDRVVPALAGVAVLVAGLGVHASVAVPFSDKLGDLLYAALVALGLWFLAPRSPAVLLAGLAGAWCLGVELLQLSGVPDAAADLLPASRLVLGSGFDPLDLVAYAAGVALVVGARHVVRNRPVSAAPA